MLSARGKRAGFDFDFFSLASPLPRMTVPNFSMTPSNFSYDAIYELTKVMQGTTTKESYTYSTVGNRLTNLTASNWTYNSSNELTFQSSTTYTYDNNGNLATRVAANTSTFT